MRVWGPLATIKLTAVPLFVSPQFLLVLIFQSMAFTTIKGSSWIYFFYAYMLLFSFFSSSNCCCCWWWLFVGVSPSVRNATKRSTKPQHKNEFASVLYVFFWPVLPASLCAFFFVCRSPSCAQERIQGQLLFIFRVFVFSFTSRVGIFYFWILFSKLYFAISSHLICLWKNQQHFAS